MRVPVALHPAFGGVNIPDIGHSNRCIVVFHCCFNLYFLYSICGTSFPMLICHLYIFFGEMSVQVFGLFFSWVVCFLLLLNFKSSLYIFNNSPLLGFSFANIFSQLVTCVLILVTLSFAKQTFLFYVCMYVCMYLFIFGCVGSSLLCAGLL